jgi:hypothetical protein
MSMAAASASSLAAPTALLRRIAERTINSRFMRGAATSAGCAGVPAVAGAVRNVGADFGSLPSSLMQRPVGAGRLPTPGGATARRAAAAGADTAAPSASTSAIAASPVDVKFMKAMGRRQAARWDIREGRPMRQRARAAAMFGMAGSGGRNVFGARSAVKSSVRRK